MSVHDRETPTLDLSGLNIKPEVPSEEDVEPTLAPSTSPGVSTATWFMIAITAVNLAIGGLNYWHWASLSYNDIQDAPIFYYTDENSLARLAGSKKDPSQFIDKMIADVQANHGIVFDRNAILIAAPEFKLIPAAGDPASAGK